MMRIRIFIAMLALAPMSNLASAEIDCAKIPPGRESTDCYIVKGRLHGMESQIAADKARIKTNEAKLPSRAPVAVPPAPSKKEGQ
jgi:hypothetical protein